MIPRTVVAVALSIFLLISPAPSQVKKATFDGQAALSYIQVLASDAMFGRMSGEPGGEAAADYVAAKLKEWGLEPAGASGSYFQPMTYEYYAVQKGAALGIVAHNRTRDFVYGEDWRQMRYSGSLTAGLDVVFVGYGISAPQKQYDDYAGIDAKGRLVLFAVETPRRLATTLREEAQLANRIKAARQHGARGVLTFRSDTSAAAGGGFLRGGIGKDLYQPDFAVISLETKVVDFIFKWQKADPRFFFQQIEETGKPQSYDLGVQSLVNLRVDFDEKRATKNVLAKMAGTDAKLKGEYVIVGGHMDHLGVDMSGDVFNGADDNASGTAVVMEAARTLKLNRFKPKRTIIFALWAAEEEGLLGSKYYTENPLYPLDKTVAKINLDMQGHGTGRVRASGAYFAPEVWEALKAGLPKDLLDNTDPGRGGPGGSDHTHFLYNGVPAFSVGTAGPHFKTNRVGDVIGLIKPDILAASGRFVVAALEVLSTEPQVPIVPRRRETFFWRFETVVNHELPALEKVIDEHKDVEDPDVDFQLAVVGAKEGLTGDTLRVELLKNLWAGKERLAQTKGLTLFGGPAPAGGGFMGSRGPAKTTVLVGLRGVAAFRDDLRWADVLAKQGVGFISLDQPEACFDAQGLTAEGKRIVEAVGKANLLLVVKGLNSAQTKSLLAGAVKPVVLRTNSLPDKDILDLVKKSESTLGLVLGKDESAASYVAKLDAAKKAVGAEYLAIVAEQCLWGQAGRGQMLDVTAELLKAKYEVGELANLFSGAFMRALNRAVRP
jgi:hypothetical protein